MQASLPSPQQSPPKVLLPTQPISVGEIIDRSFRLYRRNFKPFLYTAALVILPLTVLSGIFNQSALQSQMTALFSVVTEGLDNPRVFEDFASTAYEGSGYAAVQFALTIANLLAYILTSLALTLFAIRALRGGTLTVTGVWQDALRFFWPGLRLGFLVLLAMIGLLLVVLLLFAIVSVASAGVLGGMAALLDSASRDAATVLSVFVALCCVVPFAMGVIIGPFVYVSARWSISTPVLIDEHSGARAALSRSWRLTRGSVWRVIALFVLTYILMFILLALPTYIMQFGFLLALGGISIWLATLLPTILASIIGIAWMPLAAIFPVLLYFDLRLRAEGGDMDTQPGRLEATLGQPQPAAPAYTDMPPHFASPDAATSETPQAETKPLSTWDTPASAPDDPYQDPAKPERSE